MPTRYRRRIAAWSAGAVSSAALIALAGWTYQRLGVMRDTRRFPPSGLLLSVDGARLAGSRPRFLHVLQQEPSSAAASEVPVVFEAGLAASSLSWARVQPLVAAHTRTASYDRAGLGWSSPLRGAPSLDQAVADLRRVVLLAGGGAPVVIAAHSFGALLALALARMAPELVGGLVLIDPVSLATWGACSPRDRARLRMGALLSRRGAWLAEFGVVRAALDLLQSGRGTIARRVGKRAAGQGSPTLDRLVGEVAKLPRELWPAIAAHWSRPESFRAMARMLDVLPELACDAAPVALAAELPVSILSAESATSDELCERDQWLRHVRESQHRMVPGTGHWLHLEQPETVAEAVQWCLERVRVRV